MWLTHLLHYIWRKDSRSKSPAEDGWKLFVQPSNAHALKVPVRVNDGLARTSSLCFSWGSMNKIVEQHKKLIRLAFHSLWIKSWKDVVTFPREMWFGCHLVVNLGCYIILRLNIKCFDKCRTIIVCELVCARASLTNQIDRWAFSLFKNHLTVPVQQTNLNLKNKKMTRNIAGENMNENQNSPH